MASSESARAGSVPGPAASPLHPLEIESLAQRVAVLPEVEVLLADEASGAPPSAWGDYFFFIGEGRMRPFATIVRNDVPGFDEESRLARPGAYRLNLHIGRSEFERVLGFPPSGLADHRSTIDFSRSDVVLPHPVYATQAWVSVVNPSPVALPEVDRLVALAHRQALDRRSRRAQSP